MSKYTLDDFKKDFVALFEKNKDALLKKEKFTEALLQDKKTKIYYDGETPAANMPVFVVDEKGVQVPLMAGNHVMEDGTMLIVKQDGIIAEVQGKTPESNTDPATPANPNEIMADDKTPITGAQAKTVIESIVKEQRFEIEKAFDEKIKTQAEAFKAIEEKFTKLGETSAEQINKLTKEKTELEAKFTKQAEQNTELFALVKKIGGEAATTTATTTTVEPKPMDLVAWRKEYMKG